MADRRLGTSVTAVDNPWVVPKPRDRSGLTAPAGLGRAGATPAQSAAGPVGPVRES